MRNLIVSFLLLSASTLSAQVTGGHAMFEFLNVPVNAHLAALGGNNVSVISADPSLFLGNPALLNTKMKKTVSLNYMPLPGAIKAYQATYVHNFKKIGPAAISVKTLNYGQLDERTNDAIYVGQFGAQDYAITVGKGYTIGTISLGLNAKWMGSEIGTYKSYAWATDMGAVFKHPDAEFTVGIAVKNLGKVYRTYTPLSKDSLPFDVQLGSSYRFAHAPLRISVTARQLNKWDIVYNDPDQSTKVDDQGNAVVKKVTNMERLFRHLVLGLEVMPVEAVNLRVGYNYLMSKELSLTDAISTGGLSLGGSVRWNRFEAAYTHTIMHKAGGMDVFTLNVGVDGGYKKVTKAGSAQN